MIILQSDKQDWRTPGYVYRPLAREFDLDTDVCATWLTAKCPEFFVPPWHYPCGPVTHEVMVGANGLAQSWRGRRCWMNPPYTPRGPFRQARWLAKARDEAHRHRVLTVGLVPSRTGAQHWADSVWSGAREVRFVQGRIVFEEVPWTGEYVRLRGHWGLHPVPGPARKLANATFDAAVIVWHGHHKGLPKVTTWRPQRQ